MARSVSASRTIPRQSARAGMSTMAGSATTLSWNRVPTEHMGTVIRVPNIGRTILLRVLLHRNGLIKIQVRMR